MPIAGVDARDHVGVPDVGIDFALDELQLVELIDHLGAIFHHNVVRFLAPLIVNESEIEQSVQMLERACVALSGPLGRALGPSAASAGLLALLVPLTAGACTHMR